MSKTRFKTGTALQGKCEKPNSETLIISPREQLGTKLHTFYIHFFFAPILLTFFAQVSKILAENKNILGHSLERHAIGKKKWTKAAKLALWSQNMRNVLKREQKELKLFSFKVKYSDELFFSLNLMIDN